LGGLDGRDVFLSLNAGQGFLGGGECAGVVGEGFPCEGVSQPQLAEYREELGGGGDLESFWTQRG